MSRAFRFRLALRMGRLVWLWSLACTGCTSASSADVQADDSKLTSPSNAAFYLVTRPTRTLDDSPRDLFPGFAFEVTRVFAAGGQRLAVSRLGELIDLAYLKRADPSPFQGVKNPDPALRLGFVWRGPAAVRAVPDASAPIIAHISRLSMVRLVTRDGPRGFYAATLGFLSTDDVRVPTLSLPPSEVVGNETWIDVDLSTQTLVMYEGARPVFVTLISGGVGSPGSNFATPLGVHRVVSKWWSATMDNLEHTNVVPYSYESVPYTQYIGRVGLHAVFWHDDFGQRKSHGCINLSMTDAAYLFGKTAPELVTATAVAHSDRGTVVRVR